MNTTNKLSSLRSTATTKVTGGAPSNGDAKRSCKRECISIDWMSAVRKIRMIGSAIG